MDSELDDGFCPNRMIERVTDYSSAVFELRRYTLHAGHRDVLIALFDQHLVEPQETVGMQVIGQFRDLDRPDQFVWIRGFPDMRARKQALAQFYEGPVWKVHREAANATMIDSDNVLLLRPCRPNSGFPMLVNNRTAGRRDEPPSTIVGTLCSLRSPVSEAFVQRFEQEVAPRLVESGMRPFCYLQTEYAENTYPKLPVRTGENMFVWFASVKSGEWSETGFPELLSSLNAPPEVLRLQPTERSLLR